MVGVGQCAPRLAHKGKAIKGLTMKDDRTHPFRDSQQDREAARHIPDTAQTRAPSYKLAFADEDFMTIYGLHR